MGYPNYIALCLLAVLTMVSGAQASSSTNPTC